VIKPYFQPVTCVHT